MSRRRKFLWRGFGVAVVLTIAAGLILPRLNADRFGNRVRRSLEQALGRKVEIGKVRLDLFNGPGFSLQSVIIHEDPAVGIEPFAYVSSLEARVSFKSFWTGRLEFSTLRLVNPSVNLARPESGVWNFVPLLTGAAGAGARGMRLPEIEVRGGRINFKFGDTKSIFYLLDASLDASPPNSNSGRWALRFRGEPARSDRPALGFGVFQARGGWRPDARTGGDVEIFLDLEKSPLAELIRLLHGHDIGVHGKVATQARLAGPVSDVQIAGWMQLSDIHRWDLLPPHTEGWRLNYRGRLNVTEQTLELATDDAAGGVVPISIRFRAADYLGRPRWGAIAWFRQFPLDPLPELARHMGLAVPRGAVLRGALAGAIGYSAGAGFQGRLVATGGSLSAPGAEPVRFERARVTVDGARVSLLEAGLVTPERQRIDVDADYQWDTRALTAAIASPGLSVSALQKGPLRVAGIPLLQDLEGGSWKGQLSYQRAGDADGEWAGAFEIAGARARVPGLAEPVEIVSARAAIGARGVAVEKIRAIAGELEFSGEYQYRAKAQRPHWFRIALPAASAAELERLLLPCLRRTETFLRRALRFGRTPLPEWLAERRAEGAIEIGSFDLGELRLDNATGRVRWDGAAIDVSEFAAKLGGGFVSGRLTANLRRVVPAYRFAGRYQNIEWMGGHWDGAGTLQASGIGEDLFRNLRVETSFEARSVSPMPETEFDAVTGNCVLTVPRGLVRLLVSEVQATVGEDVFQGKGATGADGRFHLELTSGTRQMLMNGTLAPFQLDLVAKKPG